MRWALCSDGGNQRTDGKVFIASSSGNACVALDASDGSELWRHTVEGSVRKDGDRVRVTTQLVSVSDGFHLWSETYDYTLEDVFAVQDQIAQAVVSVLKVQLLGEVHDWEWLG